MSVDKSKRNRNAGTGKVYSRLSEKARKNKLEYDKKFNASPEQKKKRADRNRQRKKQRDKGNPKARVGSNYDYDHATGKMEKRSVNRGRKGEGNRK